jgi:predicted lipoprotein with Yx(FWY)xxD motif
MNFRHAAAALLAVSTLGAASAWAQPAKTQDGILVDAKGMTLYIFDKDAANSGKSVCNGQCATNWPPVMAAAGSAPMGSWTVVTRDDGAKQWAYKGMPVYLFVQDTKPGDKTGDGKQGVWHVIKP